MNKTLMIIIFSFFIISSFIYVYNSKASDNYTIYVDDDYNETTQGWEINYFASMQNAINVSVDGDIIYVHNGIYFENLIINKSIILFGESRINTIVDGTNRGDVMVILADNVSISNFTVKNSSNSGAGLNICSDLCYISKNIITNNIWSGIQTGNICKDCYIVNNTIIENGYGIFFNERSINNNFSGNYIFDNSWDGIYLDNSSDGVVAGNTIISNGDDGIGIIFCTNFTIFRNIIKDNMDAGIYLYSSSAKIIENTVTNNIASGIFLRNSNDSCICWNAVSYSENGMELTYFSSDNNIHNNSLTENSIGIHVSSDAVGNYLSDNVFLGNNENIRQEKSLTSGFEIILAIFTIMFVLLWKSHKKG